MMNLVKAVLEAYENGYRNFGIRVTPHECNPLAVGDNIPDSYDWDVENDCSTYETTGETLGGACTVGINTSCIWFDGSDEDNADLAEEIENAIQKAKKAGYWGEQIILAGNETGCEYGQDADEIILPNAKVIAIAE